MLPWRRGWGGEGWGVVSEFPPLQEGGEGGSFWKMPGPSSFPCPTLTESGVLKVKTKCPAGRMGATGLVLAAPRGPAHFPCSSCSPSHPAPFCSPAWMLFPLPIAWLILTPSLGHV